MKRSISRTHTLAILIPRALLLALGIAVVSCAPAPVPTTTATPSTTRVVTGPTTTTTRIVSGPTSRVVTDGVSRIIPGSSDPIRHNPALTNAHAQKVDQVRRLLYTAEGHYNLGNYNQSIQTYQQVLAIDPNNMAAQNGINKARRRPAEIR